MGRPLEQTRVSGASANSVKVVRLEEIDSTSGYARRQIGEGRLAGPVAIVTAKQSAGVGRFGRGWSSPLGGLWLTLAWPCKKGGLAAMVDGLGLRVGIACLRVVGRCFAGILPEAYVRLKWPNDVLIRGRKVLGVLTEIVHGPGPEPAPWVLVGVGLNANVRLDDLPETVRAHATSVQHELGREVNLRELEGHVLDDLCAALSVAGLSRELLREAAESLHGLGRDVTISLPDGARVSGLLTGLNDRGMAVLDVEGRVFVPPLGSVIMTGPPGGA